jgi:indole-3-glycerol phosphate synthase
MSRASQVGARVIGVNNRDLSTFTVDLETSIRLAPLAPEGAILVTESGLYRGEDIRQLRQCGYQGFLIGEHFMREPDVRIAVRKLIEDAS